MLELKHWPINNTKTIYNDFIGTVNECKRKSNKLWADHRREFYNKVIQKWLDDNNILMHSTHSEGKSVVAERFIRTVLRKIYKKWPHVIVFYNLII